MGKTAGGDVLPEEGQEFTLGHVSSSTVDCWIY